MAEVEPIVVRPGRVPSRVRSLIPLAGLLASVVMIISFAVVSLYVLSESSRATQVSSRNDCKTDYTSLLDRAKLTRDDLDASLNAQFGAAELAAEVGVRPTPAVVARYTATQASLTRVLAAVRAQPSLETAVREGFTLDGVHHPPCPSVG